MNEPGRYHLLLTAAGRPAQHGWWASKDIAQGKLAAWAVKWGKPGVRITLTDEQEGAVLTSWPDAP